jgi:Mn-dependent DtxR family transcriptional regulator
MGISASLVHYLLMAMTAGVTVASFEAVGSILVIGMLIVPPAAAYMLTDRLGTMLMLSAAISILSVLIGYWGAVVWNTSLAGAIAVAAGLQLGVAVLLSPKYGLVSKAFHTVALSVRIVAEDLLAGLYRQEERKARKGHEEKEQKVSAKPITVKSTHAEVTGVSALARWIARRWLLSRSCIQVDSSGALQLTDAGRHEALQLIRAHRLWETYLDENFELPVDHLHEAAHRMEHYIGPRLQDELAAGLVDATHDPHGRAIPERDAP